ncbi:MAG: DUF5118 domain-containing protein, partial [Flavobacteriaceae bacterium]|nr:DUF5118 domain-containing protein [Flavobacteriaceae bacterium]
MNNKYIETMFLKLKYLAIILFVGGITVLSAKDTKNAQDSLQLKLAKEYKELLKDATISKGLFNVLEKKEDLYFE